MLPVELKRIYDILVTLFGESKQGNFSTSEEQYQFNCPYEREENGGTPDMKFNLEINLSLGKFHTWCCNHGGNISRLIKKWGSSEYLKEYFTIINEIKESKYYDLELFKDNENSLYGVVNNVILPPTFTKINLDKCKKKKLVEYLNERKIDQTIIDKFNIGYTTWDEEQWQDRDRIIIPSYDTNGDLNFWVGRDFTNNKKKVKYKNCKIDKKEIVFEESKIQWSADIWLVEGAIDCIYGNNVISLLGKVLTKDTKLYKTLYEKANANITICLDSDVEPIEIKRIYNVLNVGRLRNKIWYVKLGTDELPWKDFGEAYQDGGKESIIKIMKSKRQFSEIELLT